MNVSISLNLSQTAPTTLALLVSLLLNSGCEGWLECPNNFKTPCQLPLFKKCIVKIQWRFHSLVTTDSVMQIHCVETHQTIWYQLWLFNVFFDIYRCIYVIFFLKHTTHTSLNRVRKGIDCVCGILVAFRFI